MLKAAFCFGVVPSIRICVNCLGDTRVLWLVVSLSPFLLFTEKAAALRIEGLLIDIALSSLWFVHNVIDRRDGSVDMSVIVQPVSLQPRHGVKNVHAFGRVILSRQTDNLFMPIRGLSHPIFSMGFRAYVIACIIRRENEKKPSQPKKNTIDHDTHTTPSATAASHNIPQRPRANETANDPSN